MKWCQVQQVSIIYGEIAQKNKQERKNEQKIIVNVYKKLEHTRIVTTGKKILNLNWMRQKKIKCNSALSRIKKIKKKKFSWMNADNEMNTFNVKIEKRHAMLLKKRFSNIK